MSRKLRIATSSYRSCRRSLHSAGKGFFREEGFDEDLRSRKALEAQWQRVTRIIEKHGY